MSEDPGPIPVYRRVRALLEERLTAGLYDNGRPLPSTRFLAQELGVSRNTVTAAYDELIALGVIESRPRIGLFAAAPLAAQSSPQPGPAASTAVDWSTILRVRQSPELTRTLGYPDAFDYPYPFISSQPELRSFPVRAWMRALNDAMSGPHLRYSIRDSVDEDDPLLVESLCSEVLPARGISATPDHVLITSGAQQGLSLVTDVLLGPDKVIGVENPGYLDAMHIFARSGAKLLPMPVDSHGAAIDQAEHFDAAYLTPSHHHPTNVTLSLQRRNLLLQLLAQRNGFAIEDDYDSEFRFRGRPTPSLKSLDTAGRVIYLGSFTKFLSAGLRIGFVVAEPEVIDALRAERHHRTKHLPGQIQRALGLFIQSGEYHKVLRAQRRRLKQNWATITTATVRHLPADEIATFPPGGMCIWYRGPNWLNAEDVARRAHQKGILVADGSRYYLPGTEQPNYLRLGFGSIPHDAIEPGIALLGELIRESRAATQG
ncbi:aminotransferase class I/II-fold pyridoxal phosphate-dependent enzyme [Gordonia sp. HNM0687]|uniref:Aminotransferase class I/II-fold pyridoxal phosphate-dependent enzyme n=1 Tax=Gordonia mangrovi TaxID=2665643 RepID=A0A6L7GVE5_9ACTN|nr:PLP-dependent aminotransferase family protein [Gordonia mangrovi]MXP23543.1 aminotransferase class I/II-fold pyridoxal phosphate-dependent enzyme [Gordonia mangrovi]UVF76562.1 PLP-dependent aminotransferase family protein [Gordonia mangrovi]